MAYRTSSARDVRRIFCWMCARCVSTVRVERKSCSAISLLVWPSAISRSTSTSRSDRSSGAVAGSLGAAAMRAPRRGLRYVPPSAARRIASRSSSSAASLSTKPSAPACSAWRAKAGSSCIVSTTMAVSGTASRTRGMASRPLPPGMLRSSTSTLGRCARVSRSASGTVPASAITCRPSSLSISSRSPWRTTVWSSAISTVVWSRSARSALIHRVFHVDDHRLRRLVEVGRSLVTVLDPDAVLERLLEVARELTGARYAAIGVLDERRERLERFVTVGIDEDTHRAIGDLPRGRGVLGVLIDDPRPLRCADVGDHPQSFGFPLAHPPMKSFLGVPILVEGRAWGNLYLTEKADGGEFTDDDEESVVVLADWAAIAIANARLYRAVRERRDELERTM